MFIFTGKTPASTTAVNSTFTFSPATGSQPPITSGTSSVPQPFTFTAGAQNTLTANQFGNSSTSTTPANFTPANFGGTSIFGTNQAVPATQPTNIFASNATGTPFKFGPVSTQATSSIASTTSTMSNSNNTSATTIPSLFGTTTNPGPFGTATTNLAPFGTTTSGPVGTTSGPFGTTTNPSPFGTATTNLAPFGTTTSGPFGARTSGPFGATTSGPFGTTTNPGPFGTATANSAPFGTTTTNPTLFGTTTSSLFGTTNSMKYTTSGSLSNQAFLATAGTSTTPFAPGTNTASTMNAFRTSNPTQTNLVGTATSGVPITTSGFGSTILTKPLDVQSNTTQTLYNFPPNTNTSTSFKFGPPTAANTSILPQSTTATSQNSTFPITTTNNINVPTTTTIPFSFLSSATNIFQTNAPATTTTSTFNPSLFTGLPVTQNQPTMTSSSSSTMISQVQKQEQNTEQSISTIQQQFLAASLLDPYANRGKKDFSSIDQIEVPIEPAVVSTLPATTITTTVTTSTPMPNTLSIQTNFRKGSSTHSLVDINFKLKPVSSSPTLNDTIKPSNQQSTISTGQMKSTLKENFTDEEELVLLGQTKISKLRLSNAIIDPSYQSNSIRSLYPSRRLVELENLINIRPPSTPKTTVNNQRISHSANENRDLSPNHHSNSSIVSPQSSSSIIQRKAKQNSQDYHLPILTRNNYYMKPTISELKSLFNDNGECILSQFTVGHEKYGSVTFYGQINVTGLNLDEIIEINRHEVIVYPDDNNKPLVGKELNLPARITLLDVYPIDRSTREEITDIERIKALNYNDYLRTITKKFDGEFINYGIHDGSWTFTVKHFTRYGLDDNQNDFIVKSKIVNQPIITSNFIEYDETM